MRFDFFVPKTKWKCIELLSDKWPNDSSKFKRMRLKQLQKIIIEDRKKFFTKS